MVFSKAKTTLPNHLQQLEKSFANHQSCGHSINNPSYNKHFPKEEVLYQFCNKRNLTTMYFNRFNYSFTFDSIPSNLAYVKLDEKQESSWHPNANATDYMASSQGNLHSLTSYYGIDWVMVGNGEVLRMTSSYSFLQSSFWLMGTSSHSFLRNISILCYLYWWIH